MRQLRNSPGPRPGRRLRELLEEHRPLVVPGTFNALGARIIEEVGFPAVYMSGYGTSVHALGDPDVGLTTMTEMVESGRRMARAVNVPVIADADTGYGNAINVIRTVQEYIAAGVAAVHLEDQVSPKRCGHVAGRLVVSFDEAVGKIRAADRARRDADPEFVVIARTDARGAVGGSLDEAIRRGQAFAQAGADVVFVEGLLSEDEIARCGAEIPVPLLYNMTGVSPRVPFEQLAALNVRLVIIPGMHHRVAAKAMWDAAVTLRDQGAEGLAQLDAPPDHPISDFHRFVGFDEVRRLEEEFLAEADVAGRYAQPSIGYKPENHS